MSISVVVSPAFETLEELADLREWDLNVFVSMPALSRRDIIHLVIVDLDTGLCGGQNLAKRSLFVQLLGFLSIVVLCGDIY